MVNPVHILIMVFLACVHLALFLALSLSGLYVGLLLLFVLCWHLETSIKGAVLYVL